MASLANFLQAKDAHADDSDGRRRRDRPVAEPSSIGESPEGGLAAAATNAPRLRMAEYCDTHGEDDSIFWRKDSCLFVYTSCSLWSLCQGR